MNIWLHRKVNEVQYWVNISTGACIELESYKHLHYVRQSGVNLFSSDKFEEALKYAEVLVKEKAGGTVEEAGQLEPISKEKKVPRV